MRIMVVGLNYAPEPTGIAPYTSGLCRGLVERGHAVRVITTMPHYPEWRIRAGYEGTSRREVIDGVAVTRLLHYVPRQPNGWRRLLSEISFGVRGALANWGRPDIVLFVSPALFGTATAMVRARLLDVPSLVWVQDVYSLGITETRGKTEGGGIAAVMTAVESAVLRRASGVAVIHDRFREVVERLAVAADRIAVVRNWTHLPQWTAVDRGEIRERLGWGDDEIIVLHSGAMGRKQDLGNVIDAARAAKRRGVPVRFVLLGNGGERPRLERLARGVRGVTFLDPLPAEEFQDTLAAADVLLVNEHAGLREMAVPSKLTSYFSSGRPVLAATDGDSVTAGELAASGGGIRVDPGRPERLLEGVLEIVGAPGRAERFGAAGLEYQRIVLSEDAAIDQYARLLEDTALRAKSTPRAKQVRAAVLTRLDQVKTHSG